jgi:hypothetical protein
VACGSLSLLVIWKLHACWPESSSLRPWLETLLLRTHAWKPYRCNRCCFVCLDQPHDMFCSVLSWPWGDFNCSAASSFHMPLLRLEKREPHGRSTEHFCEKYWRILALCFGELSENSKTVVLVFRSYHTLVTVSTWLVHRSCAFYPPYVRSKHLQENKIWNTFPCCGNTWWNDMLLATVIVVSIQVWWTLVFIEIVPMFLTFLSQCDIG